MPYIINHFPSDQKPDIIRTIYEDAEYVSPRSYTHRSRYGDVRCIRTSHNMHPNKYVRQSFENTRSKTYHTTLSRREIPVSSEDQYHIVEDITENRLDMIALKYYNDSTLWWILADANPELRFSPNYVPRGTSVRIPSFSTLYGVGGVLIGK